MYVAHEDDSHIARAREKIDRVSMRKLVRLNIEQPWLEHLQEELFDLWDMCQTVEEQELICDLLHRFCYVEGKTFSRCLSVIAQWITESWALPSEATIISKINKSKYADSSESVLWHLKSAFAAKSGWSMTNFVSSGMADAVAACVPNGNLVLVDEFSGTGGTAEKAVVWAKSKLAKAGLESVRVHFVCISAMEQAVFKIEKAADQCFAAIVLRKGIDDFYDGKELADATCLMKRLEGELESVVGHHKMPSFGYKNSQSLYAYESGNVPNNVFPVFWWRWLSGAKERRTLFRRL